MTSVKVFRADEDETQRGYDERLPQIEARRQLRLKLWRDGYHPVPTFGKQPRVPGWNTGEISETRITEETWRYTDHTNTGLLTGSLVGVDIDLFDELHVEVIAQRTMTRLGHTRLRRRGAKGMMLLYRNINDPIRKIVLHEPALADRKRGRILVEIFGDGGQFVAYGTHPHTGREYQWLEPEHEPLLVPFAALPPVTTELLRRLADELRDVLGGLGYLVQSKEAKQVRSDVFHIGGNPTEITEKVLSLLPRAVRTSATGFLNFPCPACLHRDSRSGLKVLADGGFVYHCFHASCEYNQTTGWSPGGGIGRRVLELYELLGGDPAEIKPARQSLAGINDRLADVLDELRRDREVRI